MKIKGKFEFESYYINRRSSFYLYIEFHSKQILIHKKF